MENYLSEIDNLFSKFAMFDKETIKKANRLKTQLHRLVIHNTTKDVLKYQDEERKKYICYEMFGKLPYNFRLLRLDFLMWLYLNQDREYNYNLVGIQEEYRDFITATGQIPKNFDDFIRWTKLPQEKQGELIVKGIIKNMSKTNIKT